MRMSKHITFVAGRNLRELLSGWQCNPTATAAYRSLQILLVLVVIEKAEYIHTNLSHQDKMIGSLLLLKSLHKLAQGTNSADAEILA